MDLVTLTLAVIGASTVDYAQSMYARYSLRAELAAIGGWIILLFGFFLGIANAITAANAHELWRNGDPVPDWVKQSCCGAEDLHNFDVSEVRIVQGGYLIPGWPKVIPFDKVLPSPDETVWAFYRLVDPNDLDSYANVMYCFFAPIGAS